MIGSVGFCFPIWVGKLLIIRQPHMFKSYSLFEVRLSGPLPSHLILQMSQRRIPAFVVIDKFVRVSVFRFKLKFSHSINSGRTVAVW